MNTKSQDTIVSEMAAIKGNISNIEYHLFITKDRDYIIKLITLYSSLLVRDNTNESVWYVVN